MSLATQFDLIIVGGGLAGGLIALALAERRPEVRLLLIEEGESFGGNHVWSFFDSDVAAAELPLIEPLVAHRWQGYDVRFPRHARTLDAAYHSITSERLDSRLRRQLAEGALRSGVAVSAVAHDHVRLADGAVIRADGVIDARGAGDFATLAVGWQKFVGRTLRLAGPHALTRPVVMDATVEQLDGYRFVYLLPFAPDRLFVEDTYYSDDPALDQYLVRRRIDEYVAAQGWQVEAVEREESGVLPVTMGGDFAAYWRSTGEGIAKAGVRAGLFHPTTGYSLPDAVRVAALIAAMPDLSGRALAGALERYARRAWQQRGFYRLLDRMLFRAGTPDGRYRIFERFYRLNAGLIGRFYAARSTLRDKARLLAGKPPVPFWRGLRAAFDGGRG